MADTKQSARKTRAAGASSGVWTDEERAAMQESARERRAASRRGKGDARAEGERDVQTKIAEMPPDERAMAERIHELVTTNAPDLVPRTFYGMPAYGRDGKVVCFFQNKSKFKIRYSTLGFEQTARLDEGAMWPTAFAVMELTPDVEARIVELVRKAAG